MPSLSYRESAAFKGLDGQSEPGAELLEGIFKCARFDTRFYEEVQDFRPEKSARVEGGNGKKFVLSAALEPPEGAEQDFDDWCVSIPSQILKSPLSLQVPPRTSPRPRRRARIRAYAPVQSRVRDLVERVCA